MDQEALIGTFYESALDPPKWKDSLQGLRELADSEGAALVFGPSSGLEVGISVGHSPESQVDYNTHYNALDPLVPVGLRQPVGTWLNNWRVVGPEFHRTEYYNDFFRRHGWHSCTAVVLHREERFVAAASFQRTQGREIFTEPEEERLGRVIPHLRKAFQLYREAELLRSRSTLAEAALSNMDIAVWALHRDGRIAFANQVAEAVMAARAGLEFHDGHLRPVGGAQDQFQAALRSASNTASPKPGWVRLHGRQQTLTVMPGPRRPLSREGLVIAFLRVSANAVAPAQALRSIFGLTLRESEIACMVAEGQPPKKVASILGLSTETVRSHLKSVFAKTGVRRQSELGRVLAQLPTARPVS